MFGTTLNHFKSVAAHEIFVAPADRNYFVARFCRLANLSEEFWWNAHQAVEKYLKACVVLNGVGVKNYLHDLGKIWAVYIKLFEDAPIYAFERPEYISEQDWRKPSVSTFVRKLNGMGSPESRYGLRSWYNEQVDLCLLDQLVFQLRRRTIGLQWKVGEDWTDDLLCAFNGRPFLDVIREMPSHQIRPLTLPRGDLSFLVRDVEDFFFHANLEEWDTDSRKRHVVRAERSFAHAFPLVSAKNSYTYLLREAALSGELTEENKAKLDWLRDNIKTNLFR